MAKHRRNEATPAHHAGPGFAEGESSCTALPREPARRRLTRRQLSLRKALLAASSDDAIGSAEFVLNDGIEVALDSLARSNAIVEDMLGHSAKTWRQFDVRSERIEAQLRKNGEMLAALAGR